MQLEQLVVQLEQTWRAMQLDLCSWSGVRLALVPNCRILRLQLGLQLVEPALVEPAWERRRYLQSR